MIGWEEFEEGIRVYDRRASLDILTTDWTNGIEPASLPRSVDTTIAGHTSSISLPAKGGMITEITEPFSQTRPLEGTTRLDCAKYIVQFDSAIQMVLRFSGPAKVIDQQSSSLYELQFDRTEQVTMGFISGTIPTETLVVPPTIEGLAQAISHFPIAHQTTGPNRSHPAFREHPPLLHFDESIEGFNTKTRSPPNTGITIEVPDTDPMQLSIIAPLSYYLGAEVIPKEIHSPIITTESGEIHQCLPPMPALESEVADTLRRVFFLDCLVRRVDPPIERRPDLDKFDLGERIFEESLAERFIQYRSIPSRLIDQFLPPWHLSASLPSTLEHTRVIPCLLDRMSLITAPRTGPLDNKELLERSLEDFYRRTDRPAISVNVVAAETGPGRSHAWFGDEIPIDVFMATTDAFENGVQTSCERDSFKFLVIRNEPQMGNEHEIVSEIYRNHAQKLPIDVTLKDGVSKGELERLFEEPSAFVHYVGHCDVDGLRCPDGSLSLESIQSSNAETFFLNACGSYYEGMSLVRRGSIAGGVTFTKVLNEQAATVGTTFARLIVQGFSINRAMQLARRQIMMGKNYTVVGDGTHILAGCKPQDPITYRVNNQGCGYAIAADVLPEHTAGATYRAKFGHVTEPHLVGIPAKTTMTSEEICDWLETISGPILFEGTLFWPETLRPRLEN